MKKTVVIVYEYFYPGFGGGGPVQSLVNLITFFHEMFIFKVITSAYDLRAASPYAEVALDTWNDVVLPGADGAIAVFYCSKRRIGFYKMARLLGEAKGDIIFIAGLFTTWSTFPLLVTKVQQFKGTVVLSPRGMLQRGALTLGATKKKFFLWGFRTLNLHGNIIWHATDEQEEVDIRRVFGMRSVIKVAFNIPKTPYESVPAREKKMSHLKMIYLSLIAEKKNLHLVLMALKGIETPIEFDIFGPVKDEAYWKKCLALMDEQIHKINYRGLSRPSEVQELLSQYHLFVLPTLGENFGHAIYEALSVGTPVLISPFTPWSDVQQTNAGFSVPINDSKLWTNAIKKFLDFDQADFEIFSKGAYRVSVNYYFKYDFKSAYQRLFERLTTPQT